MLGWPGCKLNLVRSSLTSKILTWLVVIHAVTHRCCAGHLNIKTSRGAPLWYSRVRAGDITCELYCIYVEVSRFHCVYIA